MGCHYQILFSGEPSPAIEHHWVEMHRERILQQWYDAKEQSANEESEPGHEESDAKESEREHEDPDALEAARGRLPTPPPPYSKKRWGDESSSEEEEDEECAKGAQGGAKRQRNSSRGTQGGAKGAQGDAKVAMIPRLPRPRAARRSAGGASSSGPWSKAASSSGPQVPGALSTRAVNETIQRAADNYMALDAKRKSPPFKTIANCAEPTLIWWTTDVELWLGGVQHLRDPMNIRQYTTADRVPKGGSIGLMGRD